MVNMEAPAFGLHVVPLKCAVQQYAWGKVGESSEVAMLAKNDPSFEFDPSATYAEFWMGTHSKGPSIVSCKHDDCMNGKELKHLINANPELLGKSVAEKFDKNLPFLFKVLSVNKSLSIQAHPTKEHAKELHTKRPDLYPDPNHKPEMAIALTKFEALCGFRPVSEILCYFNEVPEFLSVVGQAAVDKLINAVHCSVSLTNSRTNEKFENDVSAAKTIKEDAIKSALEECFSCLMKHDPQYVACQLSNMVERLKESHMNREVTTSSLGRLFLRIYEEFPGDVGCFVIYFLNYITLEPGEAIFLGPNYPHAYLSGDCIECMACSDNVVRAGLTPKYKDVATLCSMLDYTPRDPDETKFCPQEDPNDPYIRIYRPPLDEFAVTKIELPPECQTYELKMLHGASILLIVDGQAQASTKGEERTHFDMRKGTVLFISANVDLTITLNDQQRLLAFRAFCPLSIS